MEHETEMIFYERMGGGQAAAAIFLFIKNWEMGRRDLQGDGEIFFFIICRQGIKRNLEGSQGDVRGAANQFKINRIFALNAFGKQLVAQQGNFMRQAMVPVEHPVDAAFQYFVTAAELLRFLWHIVLRFNQTQFPLTGAHKKGTRTNADWMLLVSCLVV